MLEPRDLPLLPVFVAVAEAGSFTAAARQLRLSKSVVSQHVRTLEERCAVRLFERTTRSLHLTQVGERVLEAARAVMVAVKGVAQVVDDDHHGATGTLRVTAPHDLGASVVAPVAAELMGRHPDLRVELVLDDGMLDLVSAGLDVAVRLGAIRESSYVVRRLGSEPEIIVANPELVERFGRLRAPRDLANAPWVLHTGMAAGNVWSFRSGADREPRQQITVDPRALASSSQAMRALLVGGAGFGVLAHHIVEQDVAAGRLVAVCPGWSRRTLWLHALLPARKGPTRARLFVAALAEAIGRRGFRPPAPRAASQG